MRPKISLRHRFFNHVTRAFPDLVRIVFNPAWIRIELLVFLLGSRNNPSRAVKHHETRAGRTLVDCPDELSHFQIQNLGSFTETASIPTTSTHSTLLRAGDLPASDNSEHLMLFREHLAIAGGCKRRYLASTYY